MMGIPRFFAFVLLVLLVFLAVPDGASAAETRTGDSITIGSGETIDSDLYLFGREVVINGTINGDVIGTVESITIGGAVAGSLNIAARSIQINGVVDRSARVAGDELIVRGDIGGDLVTAVRSMTLTSAGSIGGDLILSGGDIRLAGAVAGDVTGSANELVLGGAVSGSVSVSANEIDVTNRGRIAGDLRYTSGTEVEILGQGDVAGTVERTGNLRALGGPDWFTTATSQIVRLLIGLVTGLVLIALFPAALVRTAEFVRKEFPISAAMGAIGLVIWIVLATILLVMIVGIPVALIGTVLLLIIAWSSQIFVGLALGRALLPSGWDTRSRGYNILAMAIGMIIVGVARGLPFPYISAAVAIVSAVVGIGAVLMALRPDPQRAL